MIIQPGLVCGIPETKSHGLTSDKNKDAQNWAESFSSPPDLTERSYGAPGGGPNLTPFASACEETSGNAFLNAD